MHHRFVILGGGSAGVSVAARLRRAGEDDVAIVEPSATHYYQPLWTLVGAGVVKAATTARAEARVLPRGVRWLQDAAAAIDPDARVVETATGARVSYDFLVVAVGLQLDWAATPGLEGAVAEGHVTSNYTYELAPHTYRMLTEFAGGTALFTGATGPVKCGGAAQKAAYLSADILGERGVLRSTDVILAVPPPSIFGVEKFASPLNAAIARYGIDARFCHEVVEVRGTEREAVFRVHDDDGERFETIGYDFLHVVPRQSAPDFLKRGPLAVPGSPDGLVDVDAATLQHVRRPEVFALGDCSGAPTPKLAPRYGSRRRSSWRTCARLRPAGNHQGDTTATPPARSSPVAAPSCSRSSTTRESPTRPSR